MRTMGGRIIESLLYNQLRSSIQNIVVLRESVAHQHILCARAPGGGGGYGLKAGTAIFVDNHHHYFIYKENVSSSQNSK